MAKPLFPEEGEKDAELEGESFEEWLLNRRGIAEGSSEAVWGGEVISFTVGRSSGHALFPPRVQTGS